MQGALSAAVDATEAWVPLQLLLGLPLIPSALNQEICGRLEVRFPCSACCATLKEACPHRGHN